MVRLPLDVLVIALVLFEDAARPLYRPLIRWLVQLRLTQALERRVSLLPPYAALVLLAVPFAVAEPLKIVGLYWMGTGHALLGLATLVLAYGTSLIIVDRIYQAGRSQLLSIGWFARIVALATSIKESVLDRLRATRPWIAARAVAARAKAVAKRLLASIRRQPFPS